MSNTGAIVLSGGEGSRLGYAEKGLLPFRWESLVERKVRQLSGKFSEVVVVTNRPELYSDLSKVVLVKDEVAYKGPLHGLHCGLEAAKHEMNFVCAVDMPFLKYELLEYFRANLNDHEIVLGKLGGHLEPLFGFYSRKILPTLSSLLSKPKLGLKAVAEKSVTKLIEEEEIRLHDPDLISYENINTQADLKRCLGIKE